MNKTPDLYQARARIVPQPPEDFSPADVSLAELREVEESLIPHPQARWTIPQRLFFEALLSSPTMDPAHAAKQAGVSLAKAKRWLANDQTRQVLDHLMRSRCERMGVSPEKTVAYIHRGLKMALGDTKVSKVFAHEGMVYSEEVFETNLGAAARFMDMLAKHVGLYREDAEVPNGVQINLQLGGDTVTAKQIRQAAARQPGPTYEHDPDVAPAPAPAEVDHLSELFGETA